MKLKKIENVNYWVIRGGSWLAYAQYMRSADRSADRPEDQYGFLGFRIVLGGK